MNVFVNIYGVAIFGVEITVSKTIPQQLQIQDIGHVSCVVFADVSWCEDSIIPISSQISAQGNTEAVKKNIENMNAKTFMYVIYIINCKIHNIYTPDIMQIHNEP